MRGAANRTNRCMADHVRVQRRVELIAASPSCAARGERAAGERTMLRAADTRSSATAKAFYESAFGWAMTEFGPTYAATLTGDTDIGLQGDCARRPGRRCR